jgi:hypothetical protein
MYAFLDKKYFLVLQELGLWYYKNALKQDWRPIPISMIEAASNHVVATAMGIRELTGYAKYMAELTHMHHVPSEALDQYYSTASKATRELVCTLYGVPIDEFIANERSCYDQPIN